MAGHSSSTIILLATALLLSSKPGDSSVVHVQWTLSIKLRVVGGGMQALAEDSYNGIIQ